MVGQNNVAPPGLKFLHPFKCVTIISALRAFRSNVVHQFIQAILVLNEAALCYTISSFIRLLYYHNFSTLGFFIPFINLHKCIPAPEGDILVAKTQRNQ